MRKVIAALSALALVAAGWSVARLDHDHADAQPAEEFALNCRDWTEVGDQVSGTCATAPVAATTTTAAPTTTDEPTTTAAPTTAAPPTTGPATTSPPPPGVLFTDAFEAESGMNRYDWQVFHGGIQDWSTIAGGVNDWWGDHSAACEAPTTRRLVHNHPATSPGPVETVGEMVWWCGPGGPETGHFMTALDTVGYGSVDFSPKQSFTNVRKVCWDMSLNDVAGWWLQLVVISEEQFQANGGDLFYASPAQFDQVARNAHPLLNGTFMLEMLRGSTHTYVGGDHGSFPAVDHPNFTNVFAIPGFPIHDQAKRYKHCLVDNDNGTVTVELYGRRSPTDVERRVHQGSLPDGEVRVIFEHASYHNSKDAAHYDSFEGRGDELTVHWDNVSIES